MRKTWALSVIVPILILPFLFGCSNTEPAETMEDERIEEKIEEAEDDEMDEEVLKEDTDDTSCLSVDTLLENKEIYHNQQVIVEGFLPQQALYENGKYIPVMYDEVGSEEYIRLEGNIPFGSCKAEIEGVYNSETNTISVSDARQIPEEN